jgi:hypothetical protein
MQKSFVAAIVAFGAMASPVSAEFIGELKFKPQGCENRGVCQLMYDFGFIDSKGVGWQARAGLKTDGASIPSWAKPIIGGSFDKDFIRAAIIHDHYCDRNVRPWPDTHRVFYEGLRASNVDEVKAKIMYYAVLVGGPKWIELIKGESCNIGKTCVRRVELPVQVPQSIIVNRESGQRFALRKAQYEKPETKQDIAEAQKIIETTPAMSSSEIEALAKKRHSTDFYFTHGDAIRFEDTSARFRER